MTRPRVAALALLVACGSSSPSEPSFDEAVVSAYRADVERSLCRLDRECDLALDLPTDDAECRLVVGGGRWPSGRAHRLDESESTECLRTLDAIDCEAARTDRSRSFEGVLLGTCFQAVRGAATGGQACYAPGDCAQGLSCAGVRNPDALDAPCPGRCEVPDGLTCADGTVCGFLEICAADGATCVSAAARLGEPCSLAGCEAPWQCVDGTCAERLEAGDSCATQTCPIGLVCGDDETCRRPRFDVGEDEPCGSDFCAEGLSCDRRCVPEADVGEPCADLVSGSLQIDCKPHLYCRTDATGTPGVCTERGMPGDACEALSARSGSFQSPCFGACIDGLCVASENIPRLCSRI